MSMCLATYELNQYLDHEESVLEGFTSCLPEYRDNVSNEVRALLFGEKSQEEWDDVFAAFDEEFEQEDIQIALRILRGYHVDPVHGLPRSMLIEALNYYSDVMYNSDIEDMLSDNDGTTLNDWIGGIL